VYKPVGRKAHPVPILLNFGEEHALQKERTIIAAMREKQRTEPPRVNDETVQTLNIGAKDFLTPEEIRYFEDICRECHLAFAFQDDQRGRLDVNYIPMVRIWCVDHTPWNHPGPRYLYNERKRVEDLLWTKIATNVAEFSEGPYANRWFCFEKPNGELRWIQDLQTLNKVTIRDAGGLPCANLLTESYGGRSIYSSFDLLSGYDQFPIDERDRPRTAMHTPIGDIQLQVVPQGWTNAVAAVQRRCRNSTL
jgi:hypothetical protein